MERRRNWYSLPFDLHAVCWGCSLTSPWLIGSKGPPQKCSCFTWNWCAMGEMDVQCSWCKNKGLHCYINPMDGSHFTLGHDHLNLWASAIIRYSPFSICIITHDMLLATRSRSCDTNQAASSSQVQHCECCTAWWWGGVTDIAATLTHSHSKGLGSCSYYGCITEHPFPCPHMSKLFQPATAAATPLAPAPPALPVIQTISNNPLLVPAHAMAQPAIPLNQFALQFEFSNNICNMLQGEGFTSSNQLCLISLKELHDMGLKSSEIAILQEATGIH